MYTYRKIFISSSDKSRIYSTITWDSTNIINKINFPCSCNHMIQMSPFKFQFLKVNKYNEKKEKRAEFYENRAISIDCHWIRTHKGWIGQRSPFLAIVETSFCAMWAQQWIFISVVVILIIIMMCACIRLCIIVNKNLHQSVRESGLIEMKKKEN